MAKAQKGKTPEKKRGAPAKAKAEPPKKKEKIEKKVVEESEHDEDEEDKLPDTSGDAALAQSMYGKRVSTRNLKAQGNKYKKAAALQKIREVRVHFVNFTSFLCTNSHFNKMRHLLYPNIESGN